MSENPTCYRARNSGPEITSPALEVRIHFIHIRGGTIPIPKNRDSGSVGCFGGIRTGIGSKGIVKGIEKELFSDSQFIIS